MVIVSGGRSDVKAELGAAAAAYFEKIARNGMRIGLSCGFTLYQTIRALRERRFRDFSLYPLSGESTLKLVDLFPNTLVGMMAAKYRPHVQAYALPVQHLLSLREIERERRRLLRDPEIRSHLRGRPGGRRRPHRYRAHRRGHAGVLLRWPSPTASASSGCVSSGVVGEINYQPFDADGQIVDRTELRALMHRVLSVEAARLQALSRRDDRHVIAVAGGRAKVEAVRGALRGHFVNVLVTDEDCAAALLR